MSTTGLDQ